MADELRNDELIYDIEDGVGRIVFNRPQARNAFTFAMYARLKEICESVPTDGSIKVLVMTGAGEKAFAAGTDMTQFRGFSKPEDAWAYEAQIDAVLSAVEACPIPTVAAINGACTGGGASVAAACDLRVATRSLKFGFPIARTLGNCLSAGNVSRLTELLGAGRVKELIFMARLMLADEALELGLVMDVVDDQAALEARTNEVVETLKGHAPLTLRASKEALRRLRAGRSEIDSKDLVAMCYMSADFKEGLEAFLAKRKPEWKGV